MLVQIDHLALTGTKIKNQSHLLETLGYEQVFFSEHIPNPVNKRALMNRWCDYHTLALYQRERSIPIEIIDYGHYSSDLSRYELQTGFSSDLIHPDDSDITENPSDIDQLNTVALKTAKPSATREFLETLGLEKENPLTLRFRSPFDGFSLFIELVKDPLAEEKSYLDTVGYPCIAFVTTDIDAELTRLADAGYKVTPVEMINLAERIIEVGFVLGPTGTPVELVAPQKNGSN